MIALTVLNSILFPIAPASATLAAGAVSGILSALSAAKGLIITLVIGMIVLAILIVAFRWLMKHREKIKGRAFVGQMMGVLRGTPQAIADPAARAELEDMRKKFEDGVEKYRSNGKDLYKLPWYLLVGPPASGKTEMMRHCNIGFPPGLHDYLQGVGGTLNMNWWFANQGIVVDTAGKMLMKEVGSGESSLWKELLAMLKRVRPQQPINGMILCISVDSLIKDSADQIEQKAGTIARQLDVIQRTLDIRFPVYIVVTKCDLITGFREFFERVTDPALQHQMVGWSNPAELDTPFNPESVDQHIEQVRQRLIRRRFSLVVDPVHTEDPQARRTDQVDALFALPESLSRLSSRLRRYLELIFVAGEWSPKPLFLRGIYFTSSMRQGAELDEEVAKIMGIGVDALPGGGMAEEKSYFIRDTLLSKVFKERGLVTRATNVDQQQRKRKLIVVGSGIGGLAALIAIMLASVWSFYSSIGKSQGEWAAIARQFDKMSVVDTSTGKPTFDPSPDVKVGVEDISRIDMLARSLALAKAPISVPFVIKPLIGAQNLMSESVPESARKAHAVVVERVGLASMIEQARVKITAVKPTEWNEDATGVLAGLINIQRGVMPKARVIDKSDTTSAAAKAAALNTPPEFKQPLHVARFLSFVLSAEDFAKAKPQADEFQSVVEETYGSDVGAIWPPTAVTVLAPDAVVKGVATFNEYWLDVAPNKSFGEIDELRRWTAEFGLREKVLVEAVARLRSGSVTLASYAKFKEDWAKGVKSLGDFEAEIQKLLSKNKEGLTRIPDGLESVSARIKSRAGEEYRVVLGEEPPGLYEKIGGQVIDKLGDKTASKAEQVTSGKTGVDFKGAVADLKGAGVEWKRDLEPLRQDLLAARKKVTGSLIDDTVASLRAYFGPTGEGGRLLSPASGNDAAYVFAARYRGYQSVAAALAAGTDENVAWGQARATTDAAAASMGKAVDELRSKLVGVLNDPAAGGVSGKDLEMVLADAATRARRTEVVKLLAGKGLEGNAESVGKLVSAASSGGQTFAISMVGGSANGLTIDRRYDPEGARKILADLAFLASLSAGKGALDAPSPVLDDPEVRSVSVTARQAMDAYAIKYGAYWTAELSVQMKVAGPAEWSMFGAALPPSSEAGRVGDELVKLSKLMEQALALLQEMSPQTAVANVEKWRVSAKADGDQANPALFVGRALDPWRELKASAREARLQLGNMTAVDFSSRYTQGFVSDLESGKPTGPMSRYLDLVRLAGLDLLASEAAGRWATLRERLGPGNGIPLSMSREDWPRGPRPVVAKLDDVRQCNELMPLVVRQGDEARLRGGTKTGLPDIDQRLEKLFGGAMAKGREELFRRLGLWLPFVLGGESEKITCDVVVPEPGEQGKIAKALDARGVKNQFGNILVTVAFVEPGLAVKRTDSSEPGATLATGLQVPGTGVLKLSALKLVGEAQAKPEGTREIGTEWSVLELLAEPDSRAIDGSEGKRWLVPVLYSGEAGQLFYKWVELRFSTAVPPKKDWPTLAQWK